MQLCLQTAADTAFKHHFIADCALFDYQTDVEDELDGGGDGDGDGSGGWNVIPFFYMIPNKCMQ